MDPPLIFESLPGVLRVRLPATGIRPSPAARAVRILSGSTLAELGRVAVGRPPDKVPEPAAVSRFGELDQPGDQEPAAASLTGQLGQSPGPPEPGQPAEPESPPATRAPDAGA